MPNYRLYFLGSDGHINRRIDLACASDAEAVAMIASHPHTNDVELWDGARQVGVFAPRSSGR